MSDKVLGGTPKGLESMCSTCRYAQRIRGMNLQELVICRNNTPVRVPFPVAECSTYDDKRKPAIWDMEKIAWQVESRNRGAVGFGEASTREIRINPPSEYPQGPSQPAINGAGRNPHSQRGKQRC